MKVLFLTPWYPDEKNPNHGIFVRRQVEALSKEHEVVVISAKIDYETFALTSIKVMKSFNKSVKEVRIRVKRSLPVLNQLNFFIRVILFTIKTGRVFKPDIIHTNIGYPGAFWGWSVAKALNVPCVLTEHTRLTNNFRSRIHKFLTLFSMKRVSAVVAVSTWHGEEIKEIAGVHPVVIPNIIDLSKYPNFTSRPAGVFQLGFLGGLSTSVKGLDLLLEACSMLDREYFLHIGGNGSLLDDYKKISERLGISLKCRFYGFVPHEEVPDFMKRLHLFVSASRWETFGIAMVEALACGLPVLATDSGGPRDFITPDNGKIVSVDANALALGLSQMIVDYHLFDPMVIRNSVINKFTDERFLEDINLVYKSVLKDFDTKR